MEIPVEEKKAGEVAEVEPPADQAPADGDGAAKKKLSFNPKDFTWTTTDRNPKNLPQLFLDRSKKGDEKLESKAAAVENPWATDSTKPAGHDASVEHIKVNIEDRSQLRKLKREEGETHITASEYAQRLSTD